MRRTALTILAIVIALAAGTGTSSAAHEECALTLNTPTDFRVIMVITSAQLDCETEQKVVHFSISLTADGELVEEKTRKCHRTNQCWSYIFVNDLPGDQQWCVQASARIGGHDIAELEQCESDPDI